MPIKFLNIKNITSTMLLLATVFFVAAVAEARLSGEAELGYAAYDAEVNGRKTDAHSFQQRYALMYDTKGTLSDSRLGRYAFTLGYEWGSFDTRIKSPDGELNPSVSAGHLLFDGKLELNPKELPFRLNAFSHNMNRITFQADSVSTLSDKDRIITPNITTNLRDGLNISSGATLVVGVKNGMTNGYNAIFRELPMLMVDYRDDILRDLKSLTPQDTRLSRLAFVSLNKKDNWFHYRQTRFTDNINKKISWTESQFQLGTVNQVLHRQWIDLTNWIKVSVDGQFTKRSDQFNKKLEAYDLNLFAVATRQTWEAKTFNTFNRTVDRRGLRYETKTPLYIAGQWGAETDWRIRLSFEDKKSEELANLSFNQRDILATLRVDTFKRSSFTLTPSISVERFEKEQGQSTAVEGSVETASTKRFSNVYGLFGGYNIRLFTNEGTVNSDFLQQTFTGRANYKPSEKIRFELEEKIVTAGGSRDGTLNGTISPRQDFGIVSSSISQRAEAVTGFYRSVSTLKAGWNPLARLKIGFTVSEDVYKPDNGATDLMTTLANSIDYTLSTLAIASNIRYMIRSVGGAESYDITANGRAVYTPNRNMEAALHYLFSQGKINGTVTTNLDFRQTFKYTINAANGVVRRLLELTEEASYVKNDSNTAFVAATGVNSRKRITLGGKYYPTKNLFLAATGRYSLLDPGSQNELLGNGTIGVMFPKLQATLDYSYGRRDVNGDNRIEKRFSANIKKLF